ncbi:alpha/beta fold hydrolase [Metabacillus fastidiosus]|uniref:alpha/beta fold hydrolase n=1 Tax=Metabacillus fastidiosus TaxID=1458 RepID=UPI003D267D0C
MAELDILKYETAYLQSYANSLELWPVEYTSYFVQTSYGKTHIIESGEKELPPLILLHGAMMSSVMWYPNVLEWSKKYRIIAIDILGDKNKSIVEKELRTREDYANWLREVFDKLSVDKADIVGLSYGALNTVNFLMYAPERVNKAVLLSPAETFVHFDPLFYSYAFGMIENKDGIENFFKWIFEERYSIHPYLYKQNEAAIKWTAASGSTASTENKFLYVFSDKELASIQAPLLLLLGEHEVMYDAKEALNRAASLVENITVGMVKGVGHLMSMENPEYINQSVLTFLADEK